MTSSQTADQMLQSVQTTLGRLAEENSRRAGRLYLDLLDASTEHRAFRLSDTELRDELKRIEAEAMAPAVPLDAEAAAAH